MSTQLSRITFAGGDIYAAEIDGEPQVAVKPVCDALGVQWEAQYKRLKRQPWASMSVMDMETPAGVRKTTVVDRRTFTMWLATIETSRLKNQAAKDTLITFQREAADALDRYFHEGGAINPRADEHQTNALIRQSQMRMELLQSAKGLIHPDHLETKARVLVARALGEAPEIDPATRPLYVQDFLAQKNLRAKERSRIGGVFGKRVKAAYVLKYGVEPHRYPLNMPNGQTRNVLAYTEADRPLMEQVWADHYAQPRLAVAS